MIEIKTIATEKVRETSEISENDDILRYNRAAEAFFDFLKQKSRPVSAGLYGALGSGKSVFLKFFKKFALNDGWKIIDIDVFDYLKADKNITKYIFNSITRETINEFFKAIVKRVLLVMFYVFIFFIVIFLYSDRGVITDGINLVKYILKSALAVIFYLVAAIAAVPYLSITVRAFYKHFSLLSWLLKISDKFICWIIGKKKWIVIIENIDRLSPDEALVFLEELKNIFIKKDFLFSGEKIYIIACDYSSLEHAVEKKYKGRHINAKDYLSKLIEFDFEVPNPEIFSSAAPVGGIGDMYINQKVVDEQTRDRIVTIFGKGNVITLRDIKYYIRKIDSIFLTKQAQNFNCLDIECFNYYQRIFLENLDKILALLIVKIKAPEFYKYIKENYYRENIVIDICGHIEEIYCQDIFSEEPSKVRITETKNGSFTGTDIKLIDPYYKSTMVIVKNILNYSFKKMSRMEMIARF